MNLVSYKLGFVLDRYETKLNLLNSFKDRIPIQTFFRILSWILDMKYVGRKTGWNYLPFMASFSALRTNAGKNMSLKMFDVVWFKHRVIHNCSRTVTSDILTPSPLPTVLHTLMFAAHRIDLCRSPGTEPDAMCRLVLLIHRLRELWRLCQATILLQPEVPGNCLVWPYT
jgi:hypothetical protein